MITSIRVVNFKNFVDETLRLGPFTIVVGTNASGKSNIRPQGRSPSDAFSSLLISDRVTVTRSVTRIVGLGIVDYMATGGP